MFMSTRTPAYPIHLQQPATTKLLSTQAPQSAPSLKTAVNLVGGCQNHAEPYRKSKKRLANTPRVIPKAAPAQRLSGLEALNIIEARWLYQCERTNVTGSPRFKKQSKPTTLLPHSPLPNHKSTRVRKSSTSTSTKGCSTAKPA